jgi:tRNA nucleotidyltransferase/poly(A) polymerase
MVTVSTAVRAYIRSLGLDAYVVGGAVRDELLGLQHVDEDFLVPGVDQPGLRTLLAPHGRVEDLEVHGQLVGVRFHPREPSVRNLTRGGIELTPPRAERSTGPGHRDFAIVADAALTVAEDLARRDFTVNAIARRLATGELVDPCGGLADLARRELRTVRASSFAEDPLRIVRGLRLVSQLGLTVAGETVAQMRLHAAGLRHVSAERIGGGVAADGMGELSKLLLGRAPVAALRLARDTGVLVELLPELRPAIGYLTGSERQVGTLDEHLFAVVEHAVRDEAPLVVRLAALLHDTGKPETAPSGGHARAGAARAATALRRLRYPARVRAEVEQLVAAHDFTLDHALDARAARRFLAQHGTRVAFELLALKEADLAAKRVPAAEREAAAQLRRLLETERDSPHTLDRLAVDGGDLLALGVPEGPELGALLRSLLDTVVDEPAANERATLLALARERLQ